MGANTQDRSQGRLIALPVFDRGDNTILAGYAWKVSAQFGTSLAVDVFCRCRYNLYRQQEGLSVKFE